MRTVPFFLEVPTCVSACPSDRRRGLSNDRRFFFFFFCCAAQLLGLTVEREDVTGTANRSPTSCSHHSLFKRFSRRTHPTVLVLIVVVVGIPWNGKKMIEICHPSILDGLVPQNPIS